MKQTCGSIAKLANDRKGWKKFVAALQTKGGKRQWWWWRLISFSLLAVQASRRLKIIFKELRQNYYRNVNMDYTCIFVFVPISFRIYFTACQLSLIHSMFFDTAHIAKDPSNSPNVNQICCVRKLFSSSYKVWNVLA